MQPEETQLNIDGIIARLLEVKGSKPGKLVNLSESEVSALCNKARDVFASQAMLLELDAPLQVCGDIHGQYYDLIRIFNYFGYPPKVNYLFLGDYVDRGRQGLETVCLLLAYKVRYPESFYMLRGNHESSSINRIYGFYDECKKRYSLKLWKLFSDCFNCMPIAALVEDRIFCMHGGLSPELMRVEDVNSIQRPVEIPDNGMLCDLLWSDPDDEITGWANNERGVSYIFGKDVVSNFLKRNDLDLICRAHQVVEEGYEFFSKKQLITIFSAPNYCGEFDNAAGMMKIDENLICSLQVLKPSEDEPKSKAKDPKKETKAYKKGKV